MNVRRAGQLPRSSFVAVRNGAARDAALSFRARGLLLFLLSHRIGHRISAAELAEAATEGRDAVRSALLELERAGYVVRHRNRDGGGRWTHELVVRDVPSFPPPGNPATAFQAPVFQAI